MSIVATDLDLVFYDEILDLKITKEGSTTTSATVLHDLLRKLPSNLDVNFDLKSQNKLKITAKNSKFNLLCLPTDDFPNFADKFQEKTFELNGKKFLSLLNKTKIKFNQDNKDREMKAFLQFANSIKNKKELESYEYIDLRVTNQIIVKEKKTNI